MTITHAALLLIVVAALALAVDLAALLTRIPCETGVPRPRRESTPDPSAAYYFAHVVAYFSGPLRVHRALPAILRRAPAVRPRLGA
jgi:hypothetical protein